MAAGTGSNPYLAGYLERMSAAPSSIKNLLSPDTSQEVRDSLVEWIRDLDDPLSSQRLQIKYAFSVPSSDALQAIAELPITLIISAGAGTGYWEQQMAASNVAVAAFDANNVYPEAMRHYPILTGGPELLQLSPEALLDAFKAHNGGLKTASLPSWEHAALFLAWPDDEESCTFGADCLQSFQGNTIIHVGELVGRTHSTNCWGQSTSELAQRLLMTRFRCVREISLPQWPCHCDALTVWRRVQGHVQLDDAEFVCL